jgi:HSP20 family protein
MTTLVRWNPFRTQDRFNDARSLWNAWNAPARSLEDARAYEWAPAVDIFERNGQIHLVAELPGVEQKDVNVSVEHNVLTISGERRAEESVDENNYHRCERVQGAFRRSFALPNTADRDKVQASFKNGLLTIVVPQKPEAQPRSIEVHAA